MINWHRSIININNFIESLKKSSLELIKANKLKIKNKKFKIPFKADQEIVKN